MTVVSFSAASAIHVRATGDPPQYQGNVSLAPVGDACTVPIPMDVPSVPMVTS